MRCIFVGACVTRKTTGDLVEATHEKKAKEKRNEKRIFSKTRY